MDEEEDKRIIGKLSTYLDLKLKIMYPLSKHPLGKKRRPGTDQCSLEARGRMGEPRTDLEKLQVVKKVAGGQSH